MSNLKRIPYMQNRELSWLEFNKRVLDQGADTSVPLLERLQFVSIFSSNLQEFFMVRVGSLTDLSYLKKELLDNKTLMTPREQIDAIHRRCHELYPLQEQIFSDICTQLAQENIKALSYNNLNDEQLSFVHKYIRTSILPYLSPQIINARHPFPHLKNGSIYIIVQLTEENNKPKSEMTKEEKIAFKEARNKAKELGAEGVTIGIIPAPDQCRRVIQLPGEGFQFILLEELLEAAAADVFSMYTIKHTNIITVTRNADLDATEGADEREEDYREHMKRILKKRGRLAPVRLESRYKLSNTISEFLLKRLGLESYQTYVTSVPFDMSFVFGLPGMIPDKLSKQFTSAHFSPAWPANVSHNKSLIEQVHKRELLFNYPYESMDPFVQLLREAATDPNVVAIKITLYRLASQSHLAEALISAAESGKEVTALFELRARFDESNNIQWSQRFEEAGANVIYGFHDYKVHSKICSITRKTSNGLEYITQLGTGNYNEKTAKLYTDFSFITTNEEIGLDAVEFFRNMGLENVSRNYQKLWVAPLQIKPNIIAGIDEQIALAKAGKPCGLFFKTNSLTDKVIIEKLAQASQAGVPTTLFVRGISCLIPGLRAFTENIHVVSIVGRLLEHSRIYGFGPHKDMKIYLASADLMTRNMDKRVEIAWPVENEELRRQIVEYIDISLSDTAKLRELKSDGTYTPLLHFAVDENKKTIEPFNSQQYLIENTAEKSKQALLEESKEKDSFYKIPMHASLQPKDIADNDLEEIFSEALKHEIPDEVINDDFTLAAMAAYKVLKEHEETNGNTNDKSDKVIEQAIQAANKALSIKEQKAQPPVAQKNESAPLSTPNKKPSAATLVGLVIKDNLSSLFKRKKY